MKTMTYAILGKTFTTSMLGVKTTIRKGRAFPIKSVSREGIRLIGGHGVCEYIPLDYIRKYVERWTETVRKGNVTTKVAKEQDVTKAWVDYWAKEAAKDAEAALKEVRCELKARLRANMKWLKAVKDGKVEAEIAELRMKLAKMVA